MSTTDTTVIPSSAGNGNAPFQEITLSKIRPSKINPRRRMDEAALAELAENIKTHGVLQPILVRPFPADGYQIVCGERRWRASKTAGKDSIPARIVNLSDAEALEIAVIENLQRENVHELDEALGYKALMKQDTALYTVETIAAKVGRSVKYVYGRLKLAELTPTVQRAFYEGKLAVGHAMEIARLQPKDQEMALQECFPDHRTTAAILKDKKPRPISVHDLRYWIEREIHLNLANAPFDGNDADLVPDAGSCSTCPKRSGANPLLFSDSIRRKDICTDRNCFHGKVSALVQLRIREVEEAGEKPVRVSDSHLFYGEKPQPGVIYRSVYHEAKAAGECPTTVAGIVVEGREAGRKRYVCTEKKCPIHAPRGLALTPQEKAERKKQREALRVQQEYRKRLLQEVYQRVPSPFSRRELDFIASEFFRQLGHDSQQRLFKFFAWEVAKTKGSPGYADFPKLASVKLKEMTTAKLGRFLIVCGLISDLYFPSYSSGVSLPKESKLAREAAHYKINAGKIFCEARESLLKKTRKVNRTQSKPSAKRKRK